MDTPPVGEGDPELAAFWLRFFRWIVALLQIVGGLCGLYYAIFGDPIGPNHFLFLLGFVLFVASVWGGVLLALDMPIGVLVSLIIQALQVFQIGSDGFVYSFFCGAKLVLSLYLLGGTFSFRFPAAFYVSTNPPPDLSSVEISSTGVNVVAVLAIVCLLYVRSAHSRLPLSSSKAAPPEPPTAGTWPPAPEP